MKKPDFLRCLPSVFVVGKEYEILLLTNGNGLCMLEIGEDLFREENSGVLSSEKTVRRIRVPQSALNKEKHYTVVFRPTKERKAYFSEFFPPLKAEFAFQPLGKTENINLYHIADVHYRFEMAKRTASYFGDDTDAFIVNGDIGEVEKEEDFEAVASFVGEISQGKIPVIFSRGNHDTRGRLAERFTDYFPCDGKRTYFPFTLGALQGVVLDCGEDKRDKGKEYDSSENTEEKYLGTNDFSAYRKAQLEFLKGYNAEQEPISFAIAHICPMMTTLKKGDIFDIEREIYAQWNTELERIGIRFMLCGHYHRAFILSSSDERNILPHNYPVVVGSALYGDDLWGAAITLSRDKMRVRFTNKDNNIMEEYELLFS